MILHPVVIVIPVEPSLSGPQRVDRQRAFARAALSRCAALTGVADGDWPRRADGAPLPRDGCHKPTCAAAVIADKPVGIDVERIAPRGERLFDAVADDAEWLSAGGRSWESFFRVWTAKEAALKANGMGIGYLRECRLLARDGTDRVTLAFRGATWSVRHHAFDEHLLAVTASRDDVRWHVLNSAPG
jgi:4'-phosphopantetheinyl transferase